MSLPSIRRPIHRGSVLAAGLFVDAGSLGEDVARARLLRLMGSGARVARSGDWILVCLRVPVRMSTQASPAGLLVRYGELLSSAPLEKDELAALNTAGEAVVIVAGGAAVRVPLDEAQREDPASWIDVSDFEVATHIVPLGREQAAPAAGVAAHEVDVRASLGVAAAPQELAGLRQAFLAEGTAAQEGSGRARGAAASSAGRVQGGLGPLVRLLAGLASLLERLLPGALRGAVPGGAGSSWGGAGAAGQGRRALAVHEDRRAGRAPESSWLSALSRGLSGLALRMLVWSRLVGMVGRRQAEYVSRMLDMFERGDLDSALRHAIPLGGEAGEGNTPPLLGMPSPRGDLSISPGRSAARSAMYSGLNLFEELRRRYRRAFEQLERSGEVEKAAFVLAELLGAHEEAVSFLEKHGRLRLAAEIAEARDLPAGLIVRQWFLAGDVRRAVRLARATGAFADAVHRLEASGRVEEAQALRIAWADALAEAGQLAAAVQVIWPVEAARRLAERWLDQAIEVGGPMAAQMVLRKGRLFPESFPAVREHVLRLLRETGDEGESITRALAAELLAFAQEPSSRVLAAPVLRALLRGGAPGGDEKARRDLAESVLAVSGDGLLREEMRILWKKKRPAEGRPAEKRPAEVHVAAAGGTEIGMRSFNEDFALAARLSPADPSTGALPVHGSVAKNGIVLAVLDGMSGMGSEGDVVARLGAEAMASHLRGAFGRDERVAQAAQALLDAAGAANAAIHRAGLSDARLRGCGAAGVCATVFEATLVVAHVGDSRAYLFRDGALTALTTDHTLRNEYVTLSPKPLTQEELDAVPSKVITRAFGMAEQVKVDVATVGLCDGDVLLLCTDGAPDTLGEGRIAAILSRSGSPEGLSAALLAACKAGDASDNCGVVVARFAGSAMRRPHGVAVAPRPFVAGEVVAAEAQAAPLHATAEPRLVRRGAGDVGAIAIHDVNELPDGRLLVALGELGAWLLSREGRVLTRFAEPAHAIVMSDQGDRALLLARRGEATRIARLDLVRRRKQAWCDARIQAHAPDFDGSIWYVVTEDKLYAIDATASGWEHLWQVSERGARIAAVARDGQRLSAAFGREAEKVEIWTWELPSHKLRSRDVADGKGPILDVSLSPSGEVLVLERVGETGQACHLTLRKQHRTVPLPGRAPADLPRAALSDGWFVTPEGAGGLQLFDTELPRERLKVELAGGRASGRIRGDHLLVFDERGRLLVISLRTGGVIREIRLS